MVFMNNTLFIKICCISIFEQSIIMYIIICLLNKECMLQEKQMFFNLRVPLSCIPITLSMHSSTKDVFSLFGRHKNWMFPYLSTPHPIFCDALATSILFFGHSETKAIPIKKKFIVLVLYERYRYCYHHVDYTVKS